VDVIIYSKGVCVRAAPANNKIKFFENLQYNIISERFYYTNYNYYLVDI